MTNEIINIKYKRLMTTAKKNVILNMMQYLQSSTRHLKKLMNVSNQTKNLQKDCLKSIKNVNLLWMNFLMRMID